MLPFSSISLGKFCIHVAHIVGDDLSEHGGTLALITKLQYLLLSIGKSDSHSLQNLHLSLHCLSHHIADTHRILVGGIETILLSYEVVHGWDEHIQALLVLQERRHLLCATQLHLVTDNTQFLLGRAEILHTLDFCVSSPHTLAHDGLQLCLSHKLYLIGTS